MSTFTYGGPGIGATTLPYCNTQFEEEHLYDPSDKDAYAIRYDLRITGVLSTELIPIISPSMPTNYTVPQMQAWLDYYLRRPRRAISFVVNGQQMVAQPAAGWGTCDAENGPKPKSLWFRDLTTNSFAYEYQVSTTLLVSYNNGVIVNTAGGSVPGNSIIRNSWSETVELDLCQYSTRTREGVGGIRSDNQLGKTVDFFRESMAVVGVPAGFLRQSSQYKVDPSGLALEYRVVDKEVDRQPPKPALDGEAEYVETTTKGNAQRTGVCRVMLKGSKTTSRGALIQTAVSMAMSKLFIAGSAGGIAKGQTYQNILNYCTLKVDLLKENKIEVIASAMLKPRTTLDGKGRVQGMFGPNFNDLPFSPLVDGTGNQTSALYTSRGSAGIALQCCAYWDPSLSGLVVNPATGQANQGLQPGQAGKTPEA